MVRLKKICLILCIVISLFFFASCSKEREILNADSMEYKVAEELSQIENVEKLNDETIKALSVIVRTNFYNEENLNNSNNIKLIENNNEDNNNLENNTENDIESNIETGNNINNEKNIENYEENKNNINSNNIFENNINNNFDNTNLNQNENSEINTKNNNLFDRIFELTTQTLGQILSNGEDFCEAKYILDGESLKWSKKINKSKLLDFLNKKNISLSNTSNLKTNIDENGNLISISLAGKEISYLELKNNFNIKSAKINSIENSMLSITVNGVGNDENNVFDIKKADNFVGSQKNYKELLNYFYDSYDIKTIKK